MRNQFGRPCRVSTGQLEWPASLARAKTGEHRSLHGTEVLDISRERLPRGTGWPTEDAGRLDAEVKDAVVRCITLPVCRLHLGDRRKSRRGRVRHGAKLTKPAVERPPKNGR